MAKNLDIKIIDQDIKILEAEELKLFHSYNRHGTAEFKLGILHKLSTIITKIETLKKYK